MGLCSTYNIQRITKVKRKFFFDDPTQQKNCTEDNDNQLESSKKTESLQDDNWSEKWESNGNKCLCHC